MNTLLCRKWKIYVQNDLFSFLCDRTFCVQNELCGVPNAVFACIYNFCVRSELGCAWNERYICNITFRVCEENFLCAKRTFPCAKASCCVRNQCSVCEMNCLSVKSTWNNIFVCETNFSLFGTKLWYPKWTFLSVLCTFYVRNELHCVWNEVFVFEMNFLCEKWAFLCVQRSFLCATWTFCVDHELYCNVCKLNFLGEKLTLLWKMNFDVCEITFVCAKYEVAMWNMTLLRAKWSFCVWNEVFVCEMNFLRENWIRCRVQNNFSCEKSTFAMQHEFLWAKWSFLCARPSFCVPNIVVVCEMNLWCENWTLLCAK